MNPMIWAILLIVLGLGLVMLEVFIPSGGILGFLSIASIIAAILLAFSFGGTTAGFIFMGTAAIGLPTTIVVAFKWLPNTPVGRRLLLRTQKAADLLPAEDPREQYRELIGKQGVAKSAMLPGGAITINNATFEAVSESGAIEQGDRVEIVRIRNNRLVVKKSGAANSEAIHSEDPLSRPIDSLGIEPFDEPLS
jgi:membrane-bound ClpP family serine protease